MNGYGKLGVSLLVLTLIASVFVIVVAIQSNRAGYDPLMSRSVSSEPVDVVITWVDLSNQDWWARYNVAKGKDSIPNNMWTQQNDEVCFAIRSVLKFMPWVRNVILLTQRPQFPHWVGLEEFKRRVRVVHHDECGLEEPTYNGMTAVSLHSKIPGLSKCYIYMDDDVVIGKPLPRTYFFDGDKPVLRPRGDVIPVELRHKVGAPRTEGYGAIYDNTHIVLKESLNGKGQWSRYEILHQPNPLRVDHVERAYNSISAKNWARNGKVRSTTDFDFNAIYIINWLINIVRDEIVIDRPDVLFVEFGEENKSKVKQIEKSPPPAVCFNNELDKECRTMLERMFGKIPSV